MIRTQMPAGFHAVKSRSDALYSAPECCLYCIRTAAKMKHYFREFYVEFYMEKVPSADQERTVFPCISAGGRS